MSLITRALRQTAVWWSVSFVAVDDYGQPVVSSPIEIKVRWDDVVEEFVTSDGTKEMSRAVVMVDRDVSVGDVLMLGTLSDIKDATRPKANTGAWEVRSFSKTPNLKHTENLRVARL